MKGGLFEAFHGREKRQMAAKKVARRASDGRLPAAAQRFEKASYSHRHFDGLAASGTCIHYADRFVERSAIKQSYFALPTSNIASIATNRHSNWSHPPFDALDAHLFLEWRHMDPEHEAISNEKRCGIPADRNGET